MLRQHPQSVQAANAAYQQDLCALLCVSAQPSAPAQGGAVPGTAVAQLQLPGHQDINIAPPGRWQSPHVAVCSSTSIAPTRGRSLLASLKLKLISAIALAADHSPGDADQQGAPASPASVESKQAEPAAALKVQHVLVSHQGLDFVTQQDVFQQAHARTEPAAEPVAAAPLEPAAEAAPPAAAPAAKAKAAPKGSKAAAEAAAAEAAAAAAAAEAAAEAEQAQAAAAVRAERLSKPAAAADGQPLWGHQQLPEGEMRAQLLAMQVRGFRNCHQPDTAAAVISARPCSMCRPSLCLHLRAATASRGQSSLAGRDIGSVRHFKHVPWLVQVRFLQDMLSFTEQTQTAADEWCADTEVRVTEELEGRLHTHRWGPSSCSLPHAM